MTVDALVIDDAFSDEEHPSLKRLYLFATLHPREKDIDVSSYDMVLTVTDGDDTSTYDTLFAENAPDVGKDALAWCTTYYYDNVIKQVYQGEELPIAFGYNVPESALSDTAVLSFSSSSDLSTEGIEIATSDIAHYEGAEEIAEHVDAEGFAAEQDARTPVDEETAQRVQSLLTDYDFYGYYGGLRIGFTFGDSSSFTSDESGKAGVYRVLKGYLELTYPNEQVDPTLLPYTLQDGSIEVDVLAML